jgi:ABC-type bacteriocin/lantibiotic exporter with double-glycine peptidase domain
MPPPPQGYDARVILAVLLALATLDVPFVPQVKDTCGAASLAMVMRYWGRDVGQDEIAGRLLQKDLHGIRGSALQDFAAARGMTAIAYQGDLAQMRDYLAKGRPLIVAWKLGRGRFHDVVVVGYDETAREVLVNDPAVGAARRVDEPTFEKRWAGAGHWTLLVLPKPA